MLATEPAEPALRSLKGRVWEDRPRARKRPFACCKRLAQRLRQATDWVPELLEERGHNRGSALGQAALLTLEICWSTSVTELLLSELGIGSQPAQCVCIHMVAGTVVACFQPAACSFDSPRLYRGVLIPSCPLSQLPQGSFWLFFFPSP